MATITVLIRKQIARWPSHPQAHCRAAGWTSSGRMSPKLLEEAKMLFARENTQTNGDVEKIVR